MKRILSLSLCGISLSGCLQIGAPNLCSECYDSSEKRKTAIQEMKAKYPDNQLLIDDMNGGAKYTVKEHTRKYSGFIFNSGDILSDIIAMPVTVGLGVPLHLMGLPIDFEYGMILEKHSGDNTSSDEFFVSYSSLKEEYPLNATKKYDLLTVEQYAARQESRKIAEQKRLEQQKKEQERQAQEKAKKEQEEKVFQQSVADCTQAILKAAQKMKTLPKTDDVAVLEQKVVALATSDGLLIELGGGSKVTDFASEGVFLGNHKMFVYTSDTDYATGELFRETGYLYERAGNYKYETTSGGIHSVPAYKKSAVKISDVDPKTYLKNKSLICCQYMYGQAAKEIGIADYYNSRVCRTLNYPIGAYTFIETSDWIQTMQP